MSRVAGLFVTSSLPSTVGLASGTNFPDALSSGPHLAALTSPLPLAQKNNIGCIKTGNFLFDNRVKLSAGYVYGGSAAISTATEEYAERLMSGTDTLGNCDTHDVPPAPGIDGYDGIDKDCADFDTQAEAQTYFNNDGGSAAYNVDRLDNNRDGIACEWLP